MTKSTKTLLSLLFAFCLLSPLIAQSQPGSSWQTFDELMQSLRAEIDSLNLQIANMSSDLTQSQAQLQTLKDELQAREIAYNELSSSLMRSNESLKTCESRLQSANLKLAISIIANVVLTGGIVYLIAH